LRSPPTWGICTLRLVPPLYRLKPTRPLCRLKSLRLTCPGPLAQSSPKATAI
ncbi:hypothetical protein LPJ60_006674, partial [Coemansia sp. RSA 2675]